MSEINIKKENFGKLDDGRTADLYTLENKKGIKVKITNYGGIIVSLNVPDRNGNLADIVLGYDNLEQYVGDQNYFGALIGRYANRIAGGKFKVGENQYQLEINEKINGHSNCLHGGKNSFNKQLWTAEITTYKGEKTLKLKHLSQAGEGGFPGNLKAVVYYTLTADNKLKVEYSAETDQKTVINLTQHSYFNLKGHSEGTIEDHLLYINGDQITPVDKALIPTGEFKGVEATPFNFTALAEISKNIEANFKQFDYPEAYDHNWVLNKKKENKLELAARLIEMSSGRQLEVWTLEPGLQFYTGNGIKTNGPGKDAQKYQKKSGLCLETQHFPDSPNQKDFPSSVLKPGEKYHTITEFRFDLI